ncbi:MAG: domain S-box [Bacteroidetes bacterium]|jgi:PAS domain S-box-containing protein|nr:domain S-box [Bacteroidota bacterium]
MCAKIKILILEYDPNDIEFIRHELGRSGINYECKVEYNEQGFRNALETFKPDLILSDYSLPSFDGPTAFIIKEEMSPDIPFIFVSGTIGEENAIELIKNGVTDYVLKDKLFTLNPKITRALKDEEKKKEKAITDEKLHKARNLYAFISQVNQNIVRVKDEATLFRNACRMAIEFGKFKMSWIGLFDKENKKINLIEQCGIVNEDLSLFADASYQGEGPQDYILRTGKFFVCNDVQNDPDLLNWKPFALSRGINSCIVLPIKKSGRIVGTFNLYSTELNFSDIEEVQLLIEVTDDISFALDLFEKEKKHAALEERVVKNEKRFRALVENGTDAVAIFSPSGTVQYISPSVEKILGYNEEEAIKLDMFSLVHPDDIPELVKVWEQVLATPGIPVLGYTGRLLHKDSSWRWIEATATNMLHEPSINGIVDNFRDVTEKVLLEQQQVLFRKRIDENEAKYRQIVEVAQEGIWMIDENNKTIFVNKKFCEIFGYTFEEMLGRTNFDLMDEEGKEIAQEKLERRRSGISEDFELEFISKIGKRIWASISASPILDANGKYTGALAMLSDITERKQKGIEREKMVADIIQRSKNLEQFTYIISHNLRAPVAHILGISNVLKGELSAADRDRTHSYLFSAVDQLDNVIKDMSKILQMRSEITEDKVPVSFQELVDTIKLSIQNLIQKENAEIVTDFSAVDTVVTLKGYFHSIFYNLILNAIKYKQPDTPPIIKIRTELQKGKIMISFKDNGTGIDLKLHGNKLFGLYNRFHSNIEGKGVGLFMVKTQIEVLGGKISVTSEPGKGTEFIIELPL